MNDGIVRLPECRQRKLSRSRKLHWLIPDCDRKPCVKVDTGNSYGSKINIYMIIKE